MLECPYSFTLILNWYACTNGPIVTTTNQGHYLLCGIQHYNYTTRVSSHSHIDSLEAFLVAEGIHEFGSHAQGMLLPPPDQQV